MKIRLWLCMSVAATAFVLPTAAAHASTNLVVNPGFEEGGCGITAIVCGWKPQDGIDETMYQDTSNVHSGTASLFLFAWTSFSDGWGIGAEAEIDPAFCVPIGAGGHPSSFWYSADAGAAVSMGGVFYQTPDCTGAAAYDAFGAEANGDGWHQQTGVLLAPTGTQSALFRISAAVACDYASGCGVAANVDDLDVDDGVVVTPIIKSLTPGSGPVGTVVDIGGINFTGASSVDFNGTAASFTVDSDTEIHATVPAGARTGPITVTTPTGSGSTWFGVAPTISSFTPSCGPAGATVDIIGMSFTGATRVTFGGTETSFTVSSDSEIHAVVPSGWDLGPISVATPGGSAKSSSSFTGPCDTPPIITWFTPSSGPVGTTVDIFGYDFTGATSVTFNGTATGFTVDSDSEIHATVRSGTTTGPVAVTTPNGTGRTSQYFTVTAAAPTISSFTPTSGPVGASVDILGTSFTNATGVAFNGTSATFTLDSDSEIHATVPEGATTGQITVTTPAGTGTSSSSFTVVDDAPPVARFTFSCAELTCSFDAGASSDPDGTIQTYGWHFGDGTGSSGKSVAHTYAQAAAYPVTLTVTDNAGAAASESQTVTLIALAANGYKVKGLEKADLSWSGPGGASFDVYRNGAKIASVQATSYTDDINTKGPATYTYWVCAPATSTCSNKATVNF
jgi:PKD repeat protein